MERCSIDYFKMVGNKFNPNGNIPKLLNKQKKLVLGTRKVSALDTNSGSGKPGMEYLPLMTDILDNDYYEELKGIPINNSY